MESLILAIAGLLTVLGLIASSQVKDNDDDEDDPTDTDELDTDIDTVDNLWRD